MSMFADAFGGILEKSLTTAPLGSRTAYQAGYFGWPARFPLS